MIAFEYFPLEYCRQRARCRTARARHVHGDFLTSLDLVERCVIEPGILTGRLGHVEELPLDTPDAHRPLVVTLGAKEFWLERESLALEFLAEYEAAGRFRFLTDSMFRTRFHGNDEANHRWRLRDSAARVVAELKSVASRVLRGRAAASLLWETLAVPLAIAVRGGADLARSVHRARYALGNRAFLDMFDNMKAAGGLVSASKGADAGSAPWRPTDLPWAIDYFGIVKKRDGSHRRAVYRYLGLDRIPTIVVDFAAIPDDVVADLAPDLVDEFRRVAVQVRRVTESGR